METIYQLSFDQYEKYSNIKEWVENLRRKDQKLKILEVGGRGDLLKSFLPNDDIYILDNEAVSTGEKFILGDATDMSFKDEEFDIVVSADVFEHIAISKRKKFIEEHVRCSKLGSIIIAPFRSDGSEAAEFNVNESYKVLSNGDDYRWLLEHKELGLPQKGDIEKILEQLLMNYTFIPLGYIPIMEFMLNISHLVVYFNYTDIELYKKFNTLNEFFNTNISSFDRSYKEDENYRQIIVIRKDNEELDIRYKDVSEISESLWHEFSTLTWNLFLTLSKDKDLENKAKIKEMGMVIDNQFKQIQHLNSSIDDKQGKINQMNTLISTYEASISWRITKPLRFLGRNIRHMSPNIKKVGKGIRVKKRHISASKIYKLTDIFKKEQLNLYDTISFDMFDTLVYRKIDPPEVVHTHTAKFVAEILRHEGYKHYDIEKTLNTRYKVEGELRHKQFSEGGDYECLFTDIVFNMLKELAGQAFAEKYYQKVIDYEIETETKVLYANPEGIETLERLKALGKKIIIVSDMYLENKYIDKILESCGLNKYIDETYVSNEFGLCKGSGRLFKTLIDKNILSNHTLHVGDNYISDYRSPNSLGIKGLWYYSKTNIKRKGQLNQVIKSNNLNRMTKELLNKGSKDSDFMYKLGYDLLGPLFALYIEHVIDTCIRRDGDEIFFLAREGQLFLKIYEKIKNMRKYQLSCLPKGKYLYVSRLSTSLSSVDRFGMREIGMGLWKANQQGLFSILTTFNLNPDEFKQYAEEHGITDLKEPIRTPYNDSRLHNFIDDPRVQERINQRKTNEKGLFKAYLVQMGFFGANKTCLFVDVGWSGTIQHNISKAFINEPDFPNLHGTYFGRNYDLHLRYVKSPKTVFERGFSYDFQYYSGEDDTDYIVDLQQLFEQAATAPHGSTIGYRGKDNKVEPILKESGNDRVQEKKQMKFIEKIQSGIMDFTEDYCLLNELIQVDDNKAKAITLKNITDFIKKPSLEAVKAFEKIEHSEDWGAKNVLKIIAPNVSKKKVLHPRQLRKEIKDSFWKQGSIRKIGIPGLVYMYNRSRNKRQRGH